MTLIIYLATKKGRTGRKFPAAVSLYWENFLLFQLKVLYKRSMQQDSENAEKGKVNEILMLGWVYIAPL